MNVDAKILTNDLAIQLQKVIETLVKADQVVDKVDSESGPWSIVWRPLPYTARHILYFLLITGIILQILTCLHGLLWKLHNLAPLLDEWFLLDSNNISKIEGI